ncbi:MAG: GNAT family N-acetyltransferase [Firmicutes bacterium]|nr:GNAT family N-acetyltransferase [Bacillota bacterium]
MIRGERVILRPVRPEDINRWMIWFNDPEVIAHLSGGVIYGATREQEQEFYHQITHLPNNKIFTIMDENGRQIGNIGTHNINWEWRNATLGIVIGEKDYWGRGYGTDAMKTFINFAFNMMNLRRLSLDVFADNKRGIRCYEKAGFVVEGIKRQERYYNGKYSDVVIMGILKEELPE